MIILGISAFYHDSAAALIIDNEIIAAAQEERFSRKKNDDSFPIEASKFCLSYANVSLNDVDIIVYYEKPFLKFERILETFYEKAPLSISMFIKTLPRFLQVKLNIRRTIKKEFKQISKLNKATKILFSDHHLSHAASAYYSSKFESAAILTIDSVGEWSTAAMFFGENNKITLLRKLIFPDSVGLLYSSFTFFLGFEINSGEYKLMGLAPYSHNKPYETTRFYNIIKSVLVEIHDDGSIRLNQKFFNYLVGNTLINISKWEELFGIKKRMPNEDLSENHSNLAFAIQMIIEEIIIKMAYQIKKLTSSDNLCLAGGVALNCVANGKLLKEKIFKHIYIQPAAGDSGGALGAALAVNHIYLKNQKINFNRMKGALLGPEFSNQQIEQFLTTNSIEFEFYEELLIIQREVAKFISLGKIVGWFQGRMEFGPRALGARSILADSRYHDMQHRINKMIKFREEFRPFAPTIMEDEIDIFFEDSVVSPYMQFITNFKEHWLEEIPMNYSSLGIIEQLNCKRSKFQAVTHVDNSTRYQTVNNEVNPIFYGLIKEYKKITGYGIILNTSFNRKNEPIVCSPEDAYDCFVNSGMDLLVLGNFIIKKK